ncbi:MDR family MFS transporter [Hazenella coriacea]|nr:MFS transporter [Hazenella coriacea]
MKGMIQDLKAMDRNIWIRFIGETVNGIAFMMLMPFFALYLKDKVDSLVHVGIVMAISPIAASFGSILGGRIADLYGRKPIMIISMFGNGILMLGFLFFDSFYAFMALSAFLGIFNSLFHPAASAMVTDVTEPENRTQAFGLLRMGHNIGAAIGPLIGASVMVISKSIIFIATSSTLILYSLIVLLFIEETLPKEARGKQHTSSEDEQPTPSTWKVLLQDKVLLVFIITGVVISMGFSQTEGMLPLHFDNEMSNIFGLNNPFPYLMALNGAMVVLFQFQISRWANRHSNGKVMLLGASLFGIGLLAIGWLPFYFGQWNTDKAMALGVLLFIYAIYTLGEMVMSPVQMTFVANIAPEHLRGTYMGAAGLQWIVGGAIGPIFGGYFFEHSQGNFNFTLLGLGCLVAGFVYLALDTWIKKQSIKQKQVA